MTFEIVLDVVIGLVLIFALFSLVASIVMELVNALLNRRGRMLELGLYQSLDGQKPKRGLLFHRLLGRRAAPFTSPQRSTSLVTDRFLNLQIIQALMDNHRMPSAISADTFATALLTLINEDLRITDEKQDYGTAAKNMQDQSRLAELVLELFPNQVVFRDALEERLRYYYNDLIHRVEGWFLRETQKWLLVIGALIAFAFNVNSIDVATQLASDANLRERLVTIASSEETQKLSATASKRENAMIAFACAGESECGDLTEIAAESDGDDQKRSETLLEQIGELGLPFGQCRLGASVSAETSRAATKNLEVVGENTIPSAAQINKLVVDVATSCEKPSLTANNTTEFFGSVPGWVITALALSLGAPFWFDLLTKLVAMRLAGASRSAGSDDGAGNNGGVRAGFGNVGGEGAPIQPVVSLPVNDPNSIPIRKESEANAAHSNVVATIVPTAWERENLSTDDVRALQRLLGVPAVLRNGRIDDPTTREAIIKYQRDTLRIPHPDGTVSEEIALKLLEQKVL